MKLIEKNKEFKQDFEHLLGMVNHNNYRVDSADVNRALNSGLLWYLTCELLEKYEHELKDIADELMGAERYLEIHHETRDPIYKSMAKDEMKHADYLIKQAKMNLEIKDKLTPYTDWYKKLNERLD